MSPADKVFVVTGGGNGIGRQVTLELVAQGATVAAVDVNAVGLQETARIAGERVSTHVLDISDAAAVAAFPQQVIDEHGAVDGLFNIAGIAQPVETTLDVTPERIDRLMTVNFRGTVAMTQAFVPHLVTRPEGGRIMLTSSLSGIVPVPGAAMYGASKAAVAYFGFGLAQDLRRLAPSVTATTVIPGTIWTDIVRGSAESMGIPIAVAKAFAMSPQKAARKMIRVTMRGRASSVVGKDAHVYRALGRISAPLADRVSYLQVGNFAYRDRPASSD